MGRLESVLPVLPAVLAVSANSPYAGGAETGLASTRAELLELLPRAGAPPAFAGYEDFLRFAELLVELGLADDLMRLWWDVRPHPRLGTLEIRAPDQPTRLADTAALAELCRSLVVAADPAAAPADRGLYAQNRWAAARFGAQAALIHPETRGLVAPHELLAGAGLAPPDGLDQAGEQVAVGRAEGLRALRERLVALTYDGL
jgi:carboxylate-amine ligase